ncbi:MAG: metal-dependent hydrolase [Halobacteriales archaeon]|nr:metal-dependent hydrolase [Halobacteriales archaeon]
MPSTVVHVALAGLVGTALLAGAFSGRTILLVMLVTVLPDLDTFLGLAFTGVHRAALHSLTLPLLVAGLLLYDTRVRETSVIDRYGPTARRVAWTCVAAVVIAGIGPDLFWNGVNLLYPIHDRFYELSGKIVISNQRGLVQTIWETTEQSSPGTTRTVHYATGVDPSPGPEPKNVERIFPIVNGGMQMLIVLSSFVVVGVRWWETRNR